MKIDLEIDEQSDKTRKERERERERESKKQAYGRLCFIELLSKAGPQKFLMKVPVRCLCWLLRSQDLQLVISICVNE